MHENSQPVTPLLLAVTTFPVSTAPDEKGKNGAKEEDGGRLL